MRTILTWKTPEWVPGPAQLANRASHSYLSTCLSTKADLVLILLKISLTEGYGAKNRATTQNYWFVNIAAGIDLTASVYLHTRSAHSLFRYTSEVNKGNYEFMKIWAQFGFDH